MFTRPGLISEESKCQHDLLSQVSKLSDGGILKSQTQTMGLTAEILRKALELQASGKAIDKTTRYFGE